MKLGRLLRVGFALLVVVALVLYLREKGPAALDVARELGPLPVAGSLLAVLAGLLASALVWRALLADLGAPLALRPALHVFFLGQLGKYVPGSVFAVAAQMELGRDQGVSRSRVGTASLLFMGVLVAAGLLAAAVVLPFTSPGALDSYAWVLVVLPVGLGLLAPPVLSRLVAVALRVLRRDPLERPLSWSGTAAALGWALVMWAAYGVHLWLLVRAVPHERGPSLLLLCTGAYALAWTAGFLVVISPAGAGVREAALVVALSPVLDGPAAVAIALLSRVVQTAGDLVWGGVGALARPGVVRSASVQQLGKAADV